MTHVRRGEGGGRNPLTPECDQIDFTTVPQQRQQKRLTRMKLEECRETFLWKLFLIAHKIYSKNSNQIQNITI